MKRRFKLADGTVGSLETDTGVFTPDASPDGAAQDDSVAKPHFPLPGYEDVPSEKPLINEDPIGDVIVGNAVAGGLPKVVREVGGALGKAGANAITRLAARAVEQEAAHAAASVAPEVPASPVSKLGDLVSKAIDLHHPLKPATNLVTKVAEAPVDRALASPATARVAAAASGAGAGTKGAGWLMYLLGHAGGSGVAAPTPPNPLLQAVMTGDQ